MGRARAFALTLAFAVDLIAALYVLLSGGTATGLGTARVVAAALFFGRVVGVALLSVLAVRVTRAPAVPAASGSGGSAVLGAPSETNRPARAPLLEDSGGQGGGLGVEPALGDDTAVLLFLFLLHLLVLSLLLLPLLVHPWPWLC
ncbi:unnamed protein product [Prorocentrum cordatum]|uniref:Uncharacterized protein n=1 Tax=Prorocentrum cordatum TaxID=2364126 RepID=A0ABN9S3T8_9DINO|nr:unnamed protein product [Polarella glacialis]